MLKKIPHSSIQTIIGRYQPSKAAQALLVNNLTPEQAITQLLEAELYNDAVQFIAHGLPVMEAIYWGTQSLALRVSQWDENQIKAIDSASAWLNQANETSRIRANQLAERVGLECAPGWVAKAVYWSGTGSIVAPELPAVMPPAFLYGHAVAAAITIAAAVPEWSNGDLGYEKFYQMVIDQGLAIAAGEKIRPTSLSIKEEN